MKTVIRFLWHPVRYVTATCVSTIASAALPLLVALVPIVMAIAWVLIWAVIFILFILGHPVDLGLDEIGPLMPVVVPLLLGIMGAISITIVLVVAVIFTIVVVLPTYLITELICWRFPIRHAVLRLGIFLVAGLLLGLILEIIMMATSGFRQVQASLTILPDEIQSSVFVLLGLAVWLFLTCVCAVFVFGLTLTMMSRAKDIIHAIGKRIRSQAIKVRQPAKANNPMQTSYLQGESA